MAARAPLVVIDTNIWISAFLRPRSYAARLPFYWRADRFEVAISAPLLAELAEVLQRPRLQLKYRYSSFQVATYVRLIATLSQPVEVPGTLQICRDPNDNVVLETALASGATHLISRDEDLTRDPAMATYLAQHGACQIITLPKFVEQLQVGQR